MRRAPCYAACMAPYDISAPRLYLDPADGHRLEPGCRLSLAKPQHNYLCNVLRLSEGAAVLVFNGRDGEWRTRLTVSGRKQVTLEVDALQRPQTAAGRVHYVFAPLKHARLDYMVQKAVEMGAAALRPVLTRRTQVARVNGERMRANAVEAAEQCGILTLPEIAGPVPLPAFLEAWGDGTVVFCDEDAPAQDARAALRGAPPSRSIAVLVGPEGGFDPSERAALLARPHAVRLSLGPRILRADTAAVAALALVQATLGDWGAAP